MTLKNRGGKWHFRFMLDGKEYAQTTGLGATRPNATKAQAQEAAFRQALMEGRRPTKRIQVRAFSDAAQEFLLWAESEYREHPNSYRRIKGSFASLKLFFDQEPVSVIQEGQVESYKAWRIREHKVRDITLRHDLHALSTFFRYAQKQRWCGENPVRHVSIPSDKDAVRIHVLSPAEEKLYFNTANERLHDLGRLMIQQGCRPDEVLSLAKADVDLERGELYIRKGKSAAARRTLNLTAESKSILARLIKETKSDWLFHSPWTKQHIQRLNRAHDAAIKRAGLAFVIYDLRHTFATRMAQAGVDLATLAAILGHASLRIVQKYVHPTAAHKKEAMRRYELSALNHWERIEP